MLPLLKQIIYKYAYNMKLVLCDIDTIDTTIVSIPDLVLQRKAWVSPVLGIFNLVHVTK